MRCPAWPTLPGLLASPQVWVLRPGISSCGGFKESLKPWLPLGPYSILCTQQCCIRLLWYKVGALLPYQGLSMFQAWSLHVSTPSLGQGKTQKSGQQRLLYLFRNHSTNTRLLLVCFLHKLYRMLFPMSRVFHEESTQEYDEPVLKITKTVKGISLCLSGLP